MAKHSRYRWRGFGSQGVPEPPKRRVGTSITPKQAAFLAKLQRENGERYTGWKLSHRQASQEIDRLLKHKRQQRKS